jgi:hypothetical protein
MAEIAKYQITWKNSTNRWDFEGDFSGIFHDTFSALAWRKTEGVFLVTSSRIAGN